ncbi:MAG: biotin carboxylase N-terminal domain-containing protein [Bdellovibrionota bacterium]
MAIKKVLIANRGEIAIRIARTCKRMGLQTVGIFSEQDRKSLHLDFCDEVFSLGEGALSETYLNIPKIVSILQRSKAEGVHPGYGFLSERAPFAEAVKEAGAAFIGPRAESIRSMGDKLEAKRLMQTMGVPLLPGTPGGVKDFSEAEKAAERIGYPVLLKAAAGGGGKGMRIVRKNSELKAALEAASREAKTYFGDGTVYIEKYLENPHHIEVQVLGDGHGGGGHVFDRECSIQRRHQKLVEESPAPLLNRHPKSKEKILEVASQVVEKMKYASAGTLEFLGDDQGGFYFLEMNTRLQVEHPVTEWVTGQDLVEWQIRVAGGERLAKGPLVPGQTGHSIEVRIYSETPFDYLPTGGRVHAVQFPTGPFVRVDSAIYPGYDIPTEYDPTLMKLSVWGNDRSQAVERLRGALEELRILGVNNNQGLFWAITREKDFIEGDYGTPYLEKRKTELKQIYSDAFENLLPALAMGSVAATRKQRKTTASVDEAPRAVSTWQYTARRTQLRGEAL